VQQIGQAMTNIQSAAAAAERVFEFLGEEELEDESGKEQKIHSVRGEVEFCHVKFAYPDKPDETIIHDFSAHIMPGQKVAICGPTGAGKTTLVNLLMRFYETTGGDILIDGVNIRDMKRREVHNQFGMVLQDTWLFEGTVRENLIYNTPNVSDEQMKTACKACGIHSFIKALPQGYDTVLSDNTAISAGQKQLMTIARAMIQNSPMLILDEATSSVDTRTEVITQRAMDQLTEHRTSFVIAHRLSTIRNADIILVLRDGDIVEQGNHDELLARGGFYAELYNSQFESVA
jgi:ATP-binding cassette subfamily B protein